MGYWAWTDLEDYEPYMRRFGSPTFTDIYRYVQGQQPYLDQVLQWAHQYGMDVLMDMHGLPGEFKCLWPSLTAAGGQNGETNQGILGPIEFPNNSTNMARALNALSNMTSYVTDPRFQGVVKAIELVNEVCTNRTTPAPRNEKVSCSRISSPPFPTECPSTLWPTTVFWAIRQCDRQNTLFKGTKRSWLSFMTLFK